MAPFDGDVTQYEVQPKPDVLSVKGIRDWLRTQDPTERYCYEESGACLLHRYLTAQGVPANIVSPEGYRPKWSAAIISFPGDEKGPLNCIALGLLPNGHFSHAKKAERETFGAALFRADAFLARTHDLGAT